MKIVFGLNSSGDIYEDKNGFTFQTDGMNEPSPERFPTKEAARDQAYIEIAKDRYGAAIRDNTREEKIAMGRRIDEGLDEDDSAAEILKQAKRDYFGMVKASGAEVVGEPDIEIVQGESEFPDLVAAARKCYQGHFGAFITIEIWHDGGVAAKGIGNTEVIQRMREGDWKGRNTTIEIFLHQKGSKTKANFVLHRSDANQKGFNLCAPVIALPVTNDKALQTKAKANLSLLLTDLLELREKTITAWNKAESKKKKRK